MELATVSASIYATTATDKNWTKLVSDHIDCLLLFVYRANNAQAVARNVHCHVFNRNRHANTDRMRYTYL